MKSRTAVFSLVTLGLFAVPVCSFAQGSIVTSPAVLGATNPIVSQPVVGTPSFGDSPIVSLPGNGSKPILPNGDGAGDGDGGGNSFGTSASPITPEPGAWGLVIGGFSGGLLALRRRKK